jgi:30S ribosomal protein S31
MGKGDIKTRRGKLFNGSFGVRRPKSKLKSSVQVVELISEKPVEKKGNRRRKES